MATLADFTYTVIKQITDVLQSTATEGTATTIVDTAQLTQVAEHWGKGTVWILSGAHAGKVVVVSSYVPNTLTFPTLTTTVGNPRYGVAGAEFPWVELVKAVNQALSEEGVYVLDDDTSLTGDGTTLEFTLPAGVYKIKEVWIKDSLPSPLDRHPSHHWGQLNGKLIFDNNCAPWDNYVIEIIHEIRHPEAGVYSDVIDDEIDLDWLKWKSIENLMLWAIREYGNNPQKQYAQFLQNARDMLLNKRPLRNISVRIQTA